MDFDLTMISFKNILTSIQKWKPDQSVEVLAGWLNEAEILIISCKRYAALQQTIEYTNNHIGYVIYGGLPISEKYKNRVIGSTHKEYIWTCDDEGKVLLYHVDCDYGKGWLVGELADVE